MGNVVLISEMDWRSKKMEAIPLVLPPQRPAARPKPNKKGYGRRQCRARGFGEGFR